MSVGVHNPYDDTILLANIEDLHDDLEDVEQLAYEIEHHLHGQERWFGAQDPQTATDWGVEAGLKAYRAISGNNAFGADADDEALVIGIDDTPAQAGMIYFDLHRIMVSAASNANEWVLRVIHGMGTMAAAEAAGHYSDVMVQEARKGSPVDVMMHRTECAACKIWIRAKNGTNNATIDFFVGLHEYAR